jgi:hypothetical protein
MSDLLTEIIIANVATECKKIISIENKGLKNLFQDTNFRVISMLALLPSRALWGNFT